MALRAKVRGEWRVVSKAMARRFRARGIEVVDVAAPLPIAVIGDVVVTYQGTTNADIALELAKREADARASIDQQSFSEAAANLAAHLVDANTAVAEKAFIDQQLEDRSQTLRLDFANSSNVRSAVLDTLTGILAVTFKNGQTARYSAFAADLMAEWKAAPSPGAWFHQNVRTKSDRHPLVKDEAQG